MDEKKTKPLVSVESVDAEAFKKIVESLNKESVKFVSSTQPTIGETAVADLKKALEEISKPYQR